MASRWQRFWQGIRHAFAMPAAHPLSPDDQALLTRLAEEIVRRRLDTVALVTLQSTLPLSFVGSQALHVAKPLVSAFYQLGGERVLGMLGPLAGIAREVIQPQDYERFVRLLEDRVNIERLMTLIEQESGRLSSRP
jgi:hypothetical protein